MNGMRRFGIVAVSALLTAACATIHEPQYRFGSRQRNAAILSGTPQVFARESLINDRRREIELIDGMLADATPGKLEFGPDLSRQVESVVALSAQLGLGFDAGAALEATRAEALADKRHQIELRKLEIELAELDARAAELAAVDASPMFAAKPGEEGGDGEAGEDEGAADGGDALPVAETPPSIARPDTAAIATQLGTRIGDLRARLRELDALGDLPRRGNPREEFRDLRAYRDELRAARNEALLDDGHDDRGLALYRLRMPATVLPGDNPNRLAVLRYRVSEPPSFDAKESETLYYSWLGHLTQRLNTAASEPRTDQLGDRSLEYVGVSSQLYTPVSFYLSKTRTRQADAESPGDALFDACFNAGNADLAWQQDCTRLVVALPPDVARQAEQIFPRLEHIRIGFWLDMGTASMPDPDPPVQTLRSAVETLVKENDCDLGRELWYRALVVAIPQLVEDPKREDLDLTAACKDWNAGSAPADAADGNAATTGRSQPESSVASADEAAKRSVIDGGDKRSPIRALATLQAEAPTALSRIVVLESALSRRQALRFEIAARPSSTSPPSDSTKAATPAMSAAPPTERQQLIALRCPTGPDGPSMRCLRNRALDQMRAIVATLPPAARARLFTRKEVVRLNGQLKGLVGAVTPVAHGLSQRGGLAEGTRSLADSLLQSISEAAILSYKACLIAADSPDKCSNAAVDANEKAVRARVANALRRCETGDPIRERMTPPERLYDLLRCSPAAGSAKVYSVAPTELSQRVSTVAQAAESLQLVAAASQVVPTAGRSAAAQVGLMREASYRAQAIERNPLVVGYAELSNEVPGSEQLDFGWVFGPHMRIKPGALGDTVVYDFRPASFELTADIAVPAWWRELELRKCAAWVKDWSGERHALSENDSERLFGPQCEEATVTVPLPFGRADLDAVTRQVASAYGAGVATTRIAGVSPANLRLCGTSVQLTIRGVDLWRSPQVSLAGVEADTGSIVVLPDMEGISARFNSARLKNATGPNEKAELTVVSQSGFDRWLLPVDQVVSGDTVDWCQKTPSGRKPPFDVLPEELPRCGGTLQFALALAEPLQLPNGATDCGKAVKVQVANVDASPLSCKAGDKLLFARVRLEPRHLRGRDEVPVVVSAAEPMAGQLSVVGSDADCKSPAAADNKKTPKVSDVVSSLGSGLLSACGARERLTVRGQNLGLIDRAELMGMPGSLGGRSADGGTLDVLFGTLPGFGAGVAPPAASQNLRLFYGKEHLDTALRWLACGS